MSNPYAVVADFEAALSAYTGAPYVVCVHSCTSALMLAVAWHVERAGAPLPISIPKLTYVSVGMAIKRAGGIPTFRDEEWIGFYQLKPLPVWDSARWFTSNIWNTMDAPSTPHLFHGGMLCLSFHASKTLGLEFGGAILHDNPEADKWFRKARFHGRTEGVAPKDDNFDMIGFDCRMHLSTAAQGILRLYSLPRHNDPLPNDDYPALDQMEIFRWP